MNCGQITPGVLPETEDILSLLRQLDVHPRTLPETHEILTLLSQLYRPAPSRLPLQPVTASEPVRLEVPPAVPLAPDVLWLPVTAFFERARWDGTAPHAAKEQIAASRALHPSTRSVADTAATSPDSSPGDRLNTGGLGVSARAFFEAVRWDEPKRGAATDESPPKASVPEHRAASQLSPAEAAPSPVAVIRQPNSGQLQLPVSAFFARVAWDGRRSAPHHAGESPENLAAPQNGKPHVGLNAPPLQSAMSPGSARRESALASQPSPAPDASDLSVTAFFERVQWDGKARRATADPLPKSDGTAKRCRGGRGAHSRCCTDSGGCGASTGQR